jgi:hypothetical protein
MKGLCIQFPNVLSESQYVEEFYCDQKQTLVILSGVLIATQITALTELALQL